MLKWVVIPILFAGTYAASIRIVNGTDASEGEFPFAVSLRRNMNHTCGATILNESRILTAAHCTCLPTPGGSPLNASWFTIQYGSIEISATMERSIQVSKINCNAINFANRTVHNDVAVLEQANSRKVSGRDSPYVVSTTYKHQPQIGFGLIRPYQCSIEIPLPDDGTWAPVDLAREFDGSMEHSGVIIGWGRIWQDGPHPEVLQKLNVDIYTDSVCGAKFETDEHVCFGTSLGSACNGDSGTALLVNGRQVGIASFITAPCGTANEEFPNVYTKVTHFLDFIDEYAAL